ncbi:MAG: ABC transporter ATP-binding protein [Planctomycetaceae bacterium]|nr:ABC transporter ATP-binding protein [Planctomycetaceae bacterium]
MPTPAANVLIRTDRLCKTYPDGAVNALIDVDVEIGRGEFVAITGPSGCGKSTLLNLLGALDTPTSGEIYFAGEPLSQSADIDAFRARRVGYIFQSFHLLPTLTAAENVQLPMFEAGESPTARARKACELLESVGLGHRLHHHPPKLSVGERQRVAIARAISNSPELLLADEPTGNLDTKNAFEVLELLSHLHRDRGMTIVMVTHGPEIADRAQRIVRMLDGRVESTAATV